MTRGYGKVNLRQLEVFEAIMRNGSVSEAARSLGVSQPAVTKSLRLAEQAAGFLLFRRVRGRLFPSPEAEMLLPHVEQIRSDLGGISSLMQQLREGNAGSVTVAAPASLAQSFLTPAIAKFIRERPSIQVEAMILPTQLVADRVAQSQVDFGLVHEPIDNGRIDDELVSQSEAVCIMRHDHPLAQRRTVGARDLRGGPLICYRDDTAIGSRVRKALIAAGLRPEVNIVVNNSEQAFDLVEAGAGLAVAEPFMQITHPRATLASVPFRPSIPLRLKIIRARERPRSRAAAQLERVIRSEIDRLAHVRIHQSD